MKETFTVLYGRINSMVCKGCGNEFNLSQGQNLTYCSKECRFNYGLAECRICGLSFQKRAINSVFCDECKPLWSIAEVRRQIVEFDDGKLPKSYKNYFKWQTLRFKVFMRDNFRCNYCGRSPKVDLDCILEVDHIIPRNAGGSDRLDNLITACRLCNGGKGDIILT